MIVEPLASDDIRAALYAEPDLGQIPADEHPIPPETATLAVLVVDDDTSNLVFQQKLLETYGHQITIAGTGETAIAALRNGTFDAAILDIEMPDMNGWELAEMIRSGAAGEAAKSIPLVALSGHAAREIAARAQNTGFDEVLTKPAQAKTVIQVLRTAVGGRSQTQTQTDTPVASVPAAEIRQAIQDGDTDRAERMVAELRQHPLPSGVAELIFRLLLALRRNDTDAINRLTVELEKESNS